MRTVRSVIVVLLCCLLSFVAAPLGASADRASSHSEPPSGPILVVGDSLSAAYGMDPALGWVSLLENQLSPQGLAVVNASISGETTSGGLTRLPGLLERNRPSIVMLELGANDGLRGLSLGQTRENLDQMIQLSREAGAKVLLIGIQLPVNYGSRFRQRFAAIYPELAELHQVPLIPFLLEGLLDGLAPDPNLMLSDGVHPNADAQPILLQTVLAGLEPMLAEPTNGLSATTNEEAP